MAVDIPRRQFIWALCGAVAAWPLIARAQQPARPVIGFLNGGSPDTFAYLVTAFKQGLNESGYVEGQNVAIEYRWAEERYDRLPALADELVHDHVDVLVATGGDPSPRAAKRATDTIPIVFLSGLDPIESGLVGSLNRPDGNATGVSFFTIVLLAKQLELLCELVPKAAVVAFLANPSSQNFARSVDEVQTAGLRLNRQIKIFNAVTEVDLDLAFSKMVQEGVNALLIEPEPLFTSKREQIVALTTRERIPAMYFPREFAASGGLASYGTSLVGVYMQVGIYAGRILKGAKPADLPILQPIKFDLTINLKTAKALGLTVPQTLLVAADEVIE
jgi:putative ABC transport system substrate-binding protein